MKIHWIQHVPFEGLGCIDLWLAEKGHDVTCTRLWAGDIFPRVGKIGGLIVMGGPMGVTDEDQYPWLADEKAFIKAVIDQDKPVLGICLGAQLIAAVLGSRVWKNEQKEIGFFPTFGKGSALTKQRPPGGLRSVATVSKHWKLPDEFMAFHWHGDTFGIPDGAVHLASSEATENQAFLYKNNVLALQFHLETTEESLMSLYENAQDEIVDAPFIQTLEEATALQLANGDLLKTCNTLMDDFIGQLFL